MRHRYFFLSLAAAMMGSGALSAACSSSSEAPGPGGGDTDASPDGTVFEGGGSDSASDGNRSDGGTGDGSTGPQCSPVTGPCDLVAQNCGANQECVLANAADGSFTTQCTAATASEHLPKGHACCPSANSNACLPGLQCIGNNCQGDAAPSGRCTPTCCFGPDGGDDTPCGKADPEGFPGHCNLTLVDNTPAQNALYSVCTYDEVCKPLHVQSCPSGFGCLVADNSGTSSCTQIFAPGSDGGLGRGEGEGCAAANECADGLMCFGNVDGGGFSCQWLCYVAGQTPPFDAGVLNTTPGYGGCPATETCFGAAQVLPNWLGVCSK